jgi:hypothetical protein
MFSAWLSELAIPRPSEKERCRTIEESMEERVFVDTSCGFLNPIMKEISNRIFTADF